MYSYEELVGIIAELRSDHGCPWDKAQTHESMISCLRNECEEVVEAIEQKDPENLCEELGDVLLQVLLHAQIAKLLTDRLKICSFSDLYPFCHWLSSLSVIFSHPVLYALHTTGHR